MINNMICLQILFQTSRHYHFEVIVVSVPMCEKLFDICTIQLYAYEECYIYKDIKISTVCLFAIKCPFQVSKNHLHILLKCSRAK